MFCFIINPWSMYENSFWMSSFNSILYMEDYLFTSNVFVICMFKTLSPADSCLVDILIAIGDVTDILATVFVFCLLKSSCKDFRTDQSGVFWPIMCGKYKPCLASNWFPAFRGHLISRAWHGLRVAFRLVCAVFPPLVILKVYFFSCYKLKKNSELSCFNR